MFLQMMVLTKLVTKIIKEITTPTTRPVRKIFFKTIKSAGTRTTQLPSGDEGPSFVVVQVV